MVLEHASAGPGIDQSLTKHQIIIDGDLETTHKVWVKIVGVLGTKEVARSC